MGKQSTLGKFWGKGANDTTKVDEEKKTDDNAAGVQGSGSNGMPKNTKPETQVPSAHAVEPKGPSVTKRQYPRRKANVSGAYDLALKIAISETRSASNKAESSKKKRRVVESEDEEELEEASGDAPMRPASQNQTPESSSKLDDADNEKPPKKRVKTQEQKDENRPSEEVTVEKIREEVKETAKAQIDQIKEAPKDTAEPATGKTTAPGQSPIKNVSAATKKLESKRSTATNPFSLAKAGTVSKGATLANAKKSATSVTKKGKGKVDPDDDNDEDETSNDKNYKPVDGKESSSSEGDDEELRVKDAGDDEEEEEEEAVDDEEEEKTAKATASKL